MVRAAASLMTGPPVREYATAEQLADEFTTWRLDGVPVRWRGMGLFFCGTIFNCRGDYLRGRALWRQVERLAEQTKASVLPLYVMVADSVRAQAEGRLHDVLTLCDLLIQRADELGSATAGRHLAGISLYWALVHLGRAGDFLVWWEESLRAGIRLSLPEGPQMLACCHALMGNANEARARADQCLTPSVLARADGLNMSQLGHTLQLALVVQDRPALQSLSTCLWPWRHLALTGNTHSSAGRLLGEAAIALGRPDEARPFFLQALEVCSRAGYRAEVALIELDLAALLLRAEPGDRLEGWEYLDRATTALESMGMRHGLQRARQLQQDA
jgi:hypothetical protein